MEDAGVARAARSIVNVCVGALGREGVFAVLEDLAGKGELATGMLSSHT